MSAALRRSRCGIFLNAGMGILLLAAPAAQAGVMIEPSRIVLQAAPTQRRAGMFIVRNPGAQPVDVLVEPEDWREGMRGSRGPVPWLTVSPQRATIRAGKRARIRYRIRVPPDATGELRAQIFFTTAASQADGSGVPIRSRVGAALYVGVAGTQQIESRITTAEVFYTASVPGVPRPDRVDVAFRMVNLGNTHVTPHGELVIRDAAGSVVGRAEIPKGWSLLPKEEDLYHAIARGVYLREGRYRLELAIEYGDDLGQPTVTSRRIEVLVDPDGRLRVVPE